MLIAQAWQRSAHNSCSYQCMVQKLAPPWKEWHRYIYRFLHLCAIQEWLLQAQKEIFTTWLMNNDLHCEGNQHKHGGEVDGDYKESCKMSQIIQLPRIRHSVRPSSSVRPSQKWRTPPFLMPCCIGCSEINKINRHLICCRRLPFATPSEKKTSHKNGCNFVTRTFRLVSF